MRSGQNVSTKIALQREEAFQGEEIQQKSGFMLERILTLHWKREVPLDKRAVANTVQYVTPLQHRALEMMPQAV